MSSSRSVLGGSQVANVQPLITGPVPMMAVKNEYLNGSRMVLKKLEWLEDHGWDQVWRARGDGDCFYRCTWEVPSGDQDVPSSHRSLHSCIPLQNSVCSITRHRRSSRLQRSPRHRSLDGECRIPA